MTILVMLSISKSPSGKAAADEAEEERLRGDQMIRPENC
jgi:hypothetical protein